MTGIKHWYQTGGIKRIGAPMSFETVEKISKSGGRRLGRVSIQRVGTIKSGQTAIVLSQDIAATMRVAIGDRVDLQLGSGPDAGFIRLLPSADKMARIVGRHGDGPGPRTPRVTFKAESIGIPCPNHNIDVEWKLDGVALVIDVRPLMLMAKAIKAVA